MTDDFYCSVFIEFNRQKSELGETIARLVKGRLEILCDIQCPWAEIYFGKNIDSGLGEAGEEDLFLYYRYKLEIEPVASTDKATYVEGISQLLTGLWEQKIPAVAACHFEDDLPDGGGKSWWKSEAQS
ncbi:1,4-dihydroxy-6-naphthoate synthase [Prosthecobacter dejongeii]|uniref:Uncharacterized protein n=1 Tax=Prosthecobacter dejongeii TaxID=48465 RepID=A0A7W8DQR6_9BACT|nr:1,4-dihydroxy-6-naphthoate synthase [Prosthecobacter dejongeii]MBB5038181.1 hypothetical protein [Prosthecobacter dejongeii]